MSYTVGIKRRWLPGYRKVQVTGHDWQNFRFILNLTDGTQEHVPGFTIAGLKVYADFWTHLAQIERTRPPVQTVRAEPPPPSRQGASAVQETVHPQQPEAPEIPPDPLFNEAKRRATERVQHILAGSLS